MAVNIKTGSMTWPFPMGKLFPGAAYATQSVPLTANVVPCDNDGVTPDYFFNGILVQASPNNTGLIYVCNSSAAPDKVGYSNVIYMLSAGQTWMNTKEWANVRDISKIFIGADNATDFAIASILQY
jgi:hypothetical protein